MLTVKEINNKVKDVIYLDDCKESMLKGFRQGYQKGRETGFIELDRIFKWLKKDVTLFAGIGGMGKSTFCYQLALIQSIQNGTKWAIFSPEQDPPDYFYNDLIHTYIGANVEKNYENQIPEELYFKGMEFVKKYFFYVFPKDDSSTPEYINSRFEELIKKENIEGCITDPFNQLTNDWEKTGRDDRYISSFLQLEKRFAQVHDIYKVIIMHPNSAVRIGDNGNFNCPNVYNLSGGAMWNNHADNIIFIHRPESITNTDNMTTIFKSAKIKKQKLVGFPGEVNFEFNRETNRFYQEGRNPLGNRDDAMRTEPLF